MCKFVVVHICNSPWAVWGFILPVFSSSDSWLKLKSVITDFSLPCRFLLHSSEYISGKNVRIHTWNFMLSRDRLIHWSCHVCLLQLIIININNHIINLCVCVSIDACIERTYKCFSLTDLNNSFIFHIAHNVLMSKFTWILILKIHLTWEILTGVKSVTTCPSISTMLFIDLCYAVQENSVLLFYANILIFLPTPVFIWSIWAWMCCFSLFHIMQQSVSIYTCL